MKKSHPAISLWIGVVLSVIICAVYAAAVRNDPERFAMFGISVIFLYFLSLPVLLLAAKSQQSAREVNRRLELLSWPLSGEADTKLLTRRLIAKLLTLLAAVLVLFALFLLSDTMDAASAAVLGAGALTLFGGALIYLHQRAFLLYGGNSFVLCHNAMYLSGTMLKLDGQMNAVFEVALDDKKHILRLGITQKGNNNYLQIPVPADQLGNVNAFIEDLEAHFEKNKAEG